VVEDRLCHVWLLADAVGRPLYKSLTTPNHIPYRRGPLIGGLVLDRQLRAFMSLRENRKRNRRLFIANARQHIDRFEGYEKRKLRNRTACQAQVGT
jgi:hypothetical protein